MPARSHSSALAGVGAALTLSASLAGGVVAAIDGQLTGAGFSTEFQGFSTVVVK